MRSRHPLKYRLLGALAALIALPLMAGAEPESLHPDVTLERLFGAGSNPVRLVKDPVDHSLYLLKTNGEINIVDVVDGAYNGSTEAPITRCIMPRDWPSAPMAPCI